MYTRSPMACSHKYYNDKEDEFFRADRLTQAKSTTLSTFLIWLDLLKNLELRRTKVTEEGMARLKKKNPALKYYLFKR